MGNSYQVTALISVNRRCSLIKFWCLFLCHSRRRDDHWLGEHWRYPSYSSLVLLCHKAALNLQYIRQICVLSCSQAVDHYPHFQPVFEFWLEVYVTVIGVIHRLGLTWNVLLLSADEDKHQCPCAVHLIYCFWFNLIKCALWLSGSRVKGITHWRSCLLWVSIMSFLTASDSE